MKLDFSMLHQVARKKMTLAPPEGSEVQKKARTDGASKSSVPTRESSEGNEIPPTEPLLGKSTPIQILESPTPAPTVNIPSPCPSTRDKGKAPQVEGSSVRNTPLDRNCEVDLLIFFDARGLMFPDVARRVLKATPLPRAGQSLGISALTTYPIRHSLLCLRYSTFISFCFFIITFDVANFLTWLFDAADL